MSKRSLTTKSIVYKFPIKKFKLSGHIYKVIRHEPEVHPVSSAKGRAIDGYHNFYGKEIGIATPLDAESCNETFWHELLEGIKSAQYLKLNHDVLTILAHELWRTHVDNKWKQFSRN